MGQSSEAVASPEMPRGARTAFSRWLSALYVGAWLPSVIAALLFVLVWHVASTFYPPFLLPSPLRTAGEMVDLFVNYGLPKVFAQSSHALALGLGLAIPTGIALGLFTGAYPLLERTIGPFLDALYVTPKVMLIPLFIIWFGIGLKARVAYIFVMAYFPIVVNTFSGVRTMRAEFTETARAFQAKPLDMFRHVYLPGSVPFIMAGIRLGVGRAILGMVTAEMFLAVVGLGYLVMNFGNRLATGKVLAMAIFVAVFGVLATELVKWLERRIAPWAQVARSGK